MSFTTTTTTTPTYFATATATATPCASCHHKGRLNVLSGKEYLCWACNSDTYELNTQAIIQNLCTPKPTPTPVYMNKTNKTNKKILKEYQKKMNNRFCLFELEM